MMDDLRMDAYYYGFEKTWVDDIDLILSAVACAGKAYHSTDCWCDDTTSYNQKFRGESPVDWIQNAAEDAAKNIAACLDACRWRPIETAPKDGTDILAIVLGAKIPAIVHWEEGYGWMDDYDDPDVYYEWNPTHWRPIGPLPELP